MVILAAGYSIVVLIFLFIAGRINHPKNLLYWHYAINFSLAWILVLFCLVVGYLAYLSAPFFKWAANKKIF
jgi:hypothetical protein